jgi:hypothetical protein
MLISFQGSHPWVLSYAPLGLGHVREPDFWVKLRIFGGRIEMAPHTDME